VVKLLDFGLAKAFTEPKEPSANAEQSPTLTIGATEVGVILGTAAYLAPEQAKGKSVDKRADIWAFGVVLYELLTGDRLFKGEDVADALAQVLTKEPQFDRVPAEARKLLRRCLEKDPKKRLRDIGDAEDLLESGAEARARARAGAKLAWVVAAAGIAIALVMGFLYIRNFILARRSCAKILATRHLLGMFCATPSPFLNTLPICTVSPFHRTDAYWRSLLK
jgi:serine/threonine-protein kinase